MAILSQKTAFGPGIYRSNKFDRDRLKRFVDGTNAAIAAGVPIPLLKKHATINASDKETLAFATDHGQGAGWIKKLAIGDDGAIEIAEAETTDDIVEQVNKGLLKFTSPEFREHYECEKAGVYSGPIIRHFAFTPLPGNPHQGPITTLALEENLLTGSFQFAEEERQPLEDEGNVAVAAKDPDEEEEDDDEFEADENDEADDDELEDDEDEEGDQDDDEIEDSQHAERGKPNKSAISRGPEEKLTFHDAATAMQYTKSGKNEYHRPTGGQSGLILRKKGNKWEHVHTDGTILGSGSGRLSMEKHLLKFHKSGDHYEEATEQQFVEGVVDEGTWEKAKKAAGKEGEKYKGDKYWAVVSTIYKSMGGKYKKNSQHAEFPEAEAEPVNIDNPDMPPVATDRAQLNAVLAGLKQLNIVLPSDFDFTQPNAIKTLLAALNSAISAKNKAEAERAKNEVDEPVTEAAMPYSEQFSDEDPDPSTKTVLAHGYKFNKEKLRYEHPDGHTVHFNRAAGQWRHTDKDGFVTTHGGGHKFEKKLEMLRAHLTKVHGKAQYEEDSGQFSEEELAAMTPKARAAIEAGVNALKAEREARIKAEQEAIAFAEQERQTRNENARNEAIRAILGTHIPPALRQTLLYKYADGQSVQFNEGAETPTLTVVEAAKLFNECLPPALCFDEEEILESDAPKAATELGADANGNPVFGAESSENYFSRNGNTGARHVDPKRAEEIVQSSPIKAAFRSPTQYVPATGGIAALVEEENRNNPTRVMDPPDFTVPYFAR